MTGPVHPFVHPSVCPSVCLSHIFYYVPTYVFAGVITIGESDVHANGQGQRSKVKVHFVPI